MRRGRARDALPGCAPAVIATAIDDEPLAAVAHLEGQGPGVSALVESRGWRRAGIAEHQAVTGLETLKPEMRRREGRPALRLAPSQSEIDRAAGHLVSAVEKREAAIAVTEESQHRRGAIDGALERRRHDYLQC